MEGFAIFQSLTVMWKRPPLNHIAGSSRYSGLRTASSGIVV